MEQGTVNFEGVFIQLLHSLFDILPSLHVAEKRKDEVDNVSHRLQEC
jgi:hypothetical protein